MSTTHPTGDEPTDARYEYRVWGRHRSARKLLRGMATAETRERVDDCYLLTADPAWNAKIRDSTLKIKYLIAEDQGFERWARGKYRSADGTPSPFDTLFEDLNLDRPQRGKSYDLERAIAGLDPNSGVRAVFVVKHRRRYRIGPLRAEVTDVMIRGSKEVLRTLSIEGDDLDELVVLRNTLGLADEPNSPVHETLHS